MDENYKPAGYITVRAPSGDIVTNVELYEMVGAEAESIGSAANYFIDNRLSEEE
jgi:hypothetical protein